MRSPVGLRNVALRSVVFRAVSVRSIAALALALLVAPGVAPLWGKSITFRSAIDNKPLNLALRPGDVLTEAMKQFYATGKNPYRGRPKALARGKELYVEFCQPCHMPDGGGKIGPSLIDDVFINDRADSDVGKFEILMDGAFGAMRSLYDRMSQDEMLKVLAYVVTLNPASKAAPKQ